MASNNITSVHKGGMAFNTQINGHAVTIDLNKDNGGNDLGTSPKILMLVSLAGCTGVDIVSILNKMKVHFSELVIDVDAHLTKEHPKIYDEVTVIYTIKVDKADRDKVRKAVDLSQEKYCGVSEMFKAFSKLSSKIIYR